jgi:hypothetical protein
VPSYHALYGASVWFLTREVIGHELRTLYDLPTELPPHLLALARQLGTIENSPQPKELPIPLHALVRKLDALEGEQSLRQFSQRLRDLPVSNPSGRAVKREAEED